MNDTDTNRGIWWLNASKTKKIRYSADTNPLHDILLI